MNIDKFGRMSFDLHKTGGHTSHALGDVSVSDAALDVQSRQVTNVASPNDPSDAVNKAYVDNTAMSLQKELDKLKYRMSGWDDHILEIYGRESNFVKMQEWDELFKEDFLDEKNKLINSLLDLISGKIKRPSSVETSDVEKINKIELLAVLEAWRAK